MSLIFPMINESPHSLRESGRVSELIKREGDPI